MNTTKIISNDIIMETLVTMLGGDKAVMENQSLSPLVVEAKSHLVWNNRSGEEWLEIAPEPSKEGLRKLCLLAEAEM